MKVAFCILGPVAFLVALWGGRTATREWSWLRLGSQQALSQETETPNIKGWLHHKGLNCVNGHGGEILGNNLISEEMPLTECMEACTGEPSCEGILTMGNKDPGPCWVRASIHSAECFMHTPWDLWLRDPSAKGSQSALPQPAASASTTSSTTQTQTTVTTTSTSPPTTTTTATKTTVTVTATATTTTTSETTTTTSTGSTVAAATTTSTTTEKTTTSKTATTTTPATTRTTSTITTTTPPSRRADTNTSGKGNTTTSAPAKEDTGNPFFGALHSAEQAVADWVIDMLPDTSSDPIPPPINQSKEPCKVDCVFKPEEPKCPACAPKEWEAPVVVVPTYERDLCKLKYLAKSLSQHDQHHNLGDVYIVWVSKHSTFEFEWQLGEIKNLISPTHKVHILDFSAQVQAFPSGGWFAQQVLKLKIADVIKSEYYIVFDSKNALISDVEADTFLTSCNQAKIFGTYDFTSLPGLHRQWYNNSAKRLNIPVPEEGRWPASITPMVMHTQTVLNMLKYIKEDSSPYAFCSGPLCDWLFQGATEFTLYLDYARYFKEDGENGTDTQNPKPSLNCTHAVIELDWDHEVAVSLWRGLETNRKVTQKIAAGIETPLMFGAQAGSLDGMEWEEHQAVAGNLVKIYENSRLFNSSTESLDEFLKCVA